MAQKVKVFHLNRKRPAQALLDAQPGLWTQPWLGARGNLLVKINNNSVMNVCLSEADKKWQNENIKSNDSMIV